MKKYSLAAGTHAWLSVSVLAFSVEVLAEEALDTATEQESPIETVMVVGKREGNYTIITEDTQKLVKMPGALGDPLGAITALPGVIAPVGGGEPAVRGSSPSDNRYYVDGMPAGYIFHEFNTSIIDENIIQDFQLYPAGFGAQYGGATGAVFDIRLRDPVNQPLETTVTASLLRAGVLFESGLTENSAFYLSTRKGLIQFFLPEEDEPDDEGVRMISAPADSDYVSKFVWSNSAHKVSVNFMGATDAAKAEFSELSDMVAQNPDFAGEAELQDKFDSQSVAWNYVSDTGTQWNVLAAHYKDREKLSWGSGYYQNLESENSTVNANVVWALGSKHVITLGEENKLTDYHYKVRAPLFTCTEFDTDCQDYRRDVIDETIKLTVKDTMAFAMDRWQLSDVFDVEIGVQWHENDHTDESFVHPRIAMGWDISSQLRVKGSAGRYDRLPDIEYTLPEIGNPNLKSYLANHYVVGFEGEVLDHWNWSVELYHKQFSRLPLTLADEVDADSDEQDLYYSNGTEGEANGIDVFINRNFSDRWYGWVALSYSESTRTNTMTAEKADYTLDTPLVLNVVGNYQLTDIWNVGFRFTAKSGEATTPITGVKQNPEFPDHYLAEYGEAYTDRLPNWSRLDIRAERPIQWFGKEGTFFVDVINALNRRNVSEITLDYEKVNNTGELHTVKEVDIGIFPSVGVSMTF